MSTEATIAENLEQIRTKIKEACLKSGRNSGQVELVAVSKKQDLEKIIAYQKICKKLSLPCLLGENYVQEFRRKLPNFKEIDEVHLIGPLQSNKAKEAVKCFDVIESVHNINIAREINKQALVINKVQKIFLQVNISDDPQKSGFSAEGCLDFVKTCLSELKNIRLSGLMTITMHYDNAEAARPDFVKLRKLRDSIQVNARGFITSLKLSMGMSADYVVAIEEGADLIRIGTSLFGSRAES